MTKHTKPKNNNEVQLNQIQNASGKMVLKRSPDIGPYNQPPYVKHFVSNSGNLFFHEMTD